MRAARLLSLILAFTLFASVSPVAAQGGTQLNDAVTDFGQNVYLVNGIETEIPNLLSNEELEKIAILQSAPLGMFLEGPVSPDGEAILAFTNEFFGFLNIQDGSQVPIVDDFPGLPLSNFFWINERFLATTAAIETDDGFIIGLGVLDRLTGETGVFRLPNDIPGIPVFASPDGRKLLVGDPTPYLDEGGFAKAELVMKVPFEKPHTMKPQRELPALMRTKGDALMAKYPELRAMKAYADAFQPLNFFSLFFIAESDIKVYDVETGASQDVLTVTPQAFIRDVSFNSDGTKLSLVLTAFGYDDDSFRPTFDGALLSEFIYRDTTGNLPPSENALFTRNQLVTFDYDSGEVKTVNASDGDGNVFASASWSSDGELLLVQTNLPARVKGRRFPSYFFQFLPGSSWRIHDRDLREIRRIDLVDVSDTFASGQFVSPDEIIISGQNRLNRDVFYYNVRSGEFRKISDRPGMFENVHVSPTTRQIVFTYTSFTDPIDIYRQNWDSSGFTRLTFETAFYQEYSQTRQYPVSFTLRNGSTQTGVLILPADVPFPPRNIPIVAWQEGGPTATMDNRWLALVESPFGLLPNFGYGVLVVPLYGRFGVGPANFNALADNNNWGSVDIDAQAEIVQQLRSRGWASSVGTVGCSYGGYFTLQSIIRHPNTYNAAHTMCSFVDNITEWHRGFNSLVPWGQGLPPMNNLEEYRNDSPIYNAGKIRTPLLTFHGTDDFLPVTLMENTHLQVVASGTPAKMIKFAAAGHGFLNNPNAPTPFELQVPYEFYGAQEQLIWFRTYLR
jgi:dipeptidyl aminopeptidase/acylaminoacyl peptidase